jgi:ribonuclease HI
MKFYAVREGHSPGVYLTWEACEAQVKGYPNAKFKSFRTKKEAEAFVKGEVNSDSGPPQTDSLSNPELVHIWVDGSCVTGENGTLRLGWAYLVIREGKEIHRASGNEIPIDAHRHRNVAGEIMAVLQAMIWCQEHGFEAAKFYYDYQGLESWADGSWRTNTPFTQAYAKKIKESGMRLTWEKVLAHSGEPNNEIVDQLARSAAQNAK